MKGKAADWYTAALDPDQPVALQISTWVGFREELLKHFVPVDEPKRACEKLLTFKQTGSVSQYSTDFKHLLTVSKINIEPGTAPCCLPCTRVG